jgi:hypothetical protein
MQQFLSSIKKEGAPAPAPAPAAAKAAAPAPPVKAPAPPAAAPPPPPLAAVAAAEAVGAPAAAAAAAGSSALTPSAAEWVPPAPPPPPPGYLLPSPAPDALPLPILMPFPPMSALGEGRGDLVWASPEHARLASCADFMHTAGVVYQRYEGAINEAQQGAGDGMAGFDAVLDAALRMYLDFAGLARERAAAEAEAAEKEAREAETARRDADNAREQEMGMLDEFHDALRREGLVEDSAEWNAKEEAFCLQNNIGVDAAGERRRLFAPAPPLSPPPAFAPPPPFPRQRL